MIRLFLIIDIIVFITSQVSSSPSVIIIGAGASGIAAVSKLFENNFKNITILEAENRIGGRINSVYLGEGFVDLGAQWCQGKNYIYNQIKDFNLLKETEFRSSVFLSSREQIDERVKLNILKIIESILFNDSFDDNANNLNNLSYAEYAIKQFNTSIYEQYGNNSELLKIGNLFKSYLENTILSLYGTLSLHEPAAITDYVSLEGHQYLNWNGLGFRTAIDILMKKFPNPSEQIPLDEHILLNKEVIKLIWDRDITIHCSDNTIYQADHVIFTPSAGVLKKDHLKLFAPPLPEQKHAAIEQIGIGAVIKVPVYYKKQWWDNQTFIEPILLWTDEDKKASAQQFIEGPIKDGHRWVTSITNLVLAERNPNVFFVWFVGDMVPEIELLSDETLIKGIRFVLNKFFGNENKKIPAPDAFYRSSWYSNPHFRGTYSYQKVSTQKGILSAETQLSQPLLNGKNEPVVLFAGEATNPTHFGTVHGAIETGFREADRIINFYKN